jgi:protein phosphatase
VSETSETVSVFAVVADGIGGHQAGEVAAELAVNYITQGIAESNAKKPLKILQQAIESGSEAISAHAAQNENQRGMGSTCVCAWVIGNKLYTAHVGDSRAYLMRGQTIRQLTKDHTWVVEAIEKGIILPEQARDHPNVHVIRRYLGSHDLPKVDFRMWLTGDEKTDNDAKENQGMEVEGGDNILLCSDGLTDLVWDDEILNVVNTQPNLKKAADKLVALANERGGHDNITAVLLGMPKTNNEPLQAPTKKSGWFGKLFGNS